MQRFMDPKPHPKPWSVEPELCFGRDAGALLRMVSAEIVFSNAVNKLEPFLRAKSLIQEERSAK